MAEQWRPVVGYEGHYDISDRGRIRSWKNGSPPRLMSPATNRGYKVISLSLKGVPASHRIHRLVLEAFVGPMPEGMVTRHLDGTRSNNLLANIVYGTPSENNRDMVLHGNGPKPHPTCRRGHPRQIGPGEWCVVCRSEAEARRAARLKAERAAARAAAPPLVHHNRAKTHCIHGHEFTPENTYIRKTKTGWRRSCRACNAAAVERRRKTLTAPRETKD